MIVWEDAYLVRVNDEVVGVTKSFGDADRLAKGYKRVIVERVDDLGFDW